MPHDEDDDYSFSNPDAIALILLEMARHKVPIADTVRYLNAETAVPPPWHVQLDRWRPGNGYPVDGMRWAPVNVDRLLVSRHGTTYGDAANK